MIVGRCIEPYPLQPPTHCPGYDDALLGLVPEGIHQGDARYLRWHVPVKSESGPGGVTHDDDQGIWSLAR
ncbi:MAG: hypothetical protein DDT25_01206 [Chloroflexi bacterium]|nr:hypothetical protein [Chloroflexota bacterium]